jgi:hypothetical protein
MFEFLFLGGDQLLYFGFDLAFGLDEVVEW